MQVADQPPDVVVRPEADPIDWRVVKIVNQARTYLKRSTSSGGLLQPIWRLCIFRASSMSYATTSAVMCLLQHQSTQQLLLSAAEM